MIIYIYDIVIKEENLERNKKIYNRIKRRFYYDLNKILKNNKNIELKTKSSLFSDEKNEKILDEFFEKYKDYLYLIKIYSNNIFEIYNI